MEIKELYSLFKAISEIAGKYNYVAIINQIRNSLNSYKTYKANNSQQAQSQTTKATIENNRKQALNALNEILPQLTDYKLVKLMSQLKVDNPYGEYAKSLLERIPNEIDTNFDSLNNEIAQYYQKASAYQQFTNSILTVLGDTLGAEPQRKDELIIFFEGEANVSNLKQLAEVSKEWNLIVNCFSRLVKENNTEIEIVSIKKGSLIATLAIASAIIGGVISASDKILNLILKVYEVKKKALELKNMRLENLTKAIEILEKESTLNLENHSKLIVKELMEEYGWNDQDGAYQETETAVTKGIRKMIKFQNSGGKVDAKYLAASEAQESKVKSIQHKNKAFLEVEEQIGRLSNGGKILEIVDGENDDDAGDKFSQETNIKD